MSCYYHPEKEEVNNCSQCKKPLCEECSIDTDGKILCKECVKDELKKVYVKKKSPSLAAVLAICPGLGAIYNGQILKAITFILIFGALVSLENHTSGMEEPIFGLLTAGFWVYMLIDSYNSARLINLGKEDPFEKGTIFLGITLLLIGIAFILANFEIIDYEQITKLWPIIFIVIGARMIYKWKKLV
ncbi:MAG: LiaI-LiaF-like domain-containing protein [Candidatus Aminicenantia bacterium]